jgi:hypothetical protein
LQPGLSAAKDGVVAMAKHAAADANSSTNLERKIPSNGQGRWDCSRAL